MSNKPVIKSLEKVLADSYLLYLKTHNYHWNVVGPQFKSLHDLFQVQYEDLALAVDDIAERIRALGELAPGKFSTYDKLSKIKEGNEKSKADAMLKDLAKDQDIISKSLQELLEKAQKAGDEATADLAIGRIQVHEKNAWMLKASL